MGELDLDLGIIVVHGEADSLLGMEGVVVPFEVDAGV